MKIHPYILIFACATANLTSCSDKDVQGNGFFEGDGMVRLVVADKKMAKTKAIISVEDAEKGEFEIQGDIDIFIYDENNLLEFNMELPLDDEGKTNPFYLDTGPKKIYVFANRPAGSTLQPGLGSTIKEFDNDIIHNITFNTYGPVEIATPGEFALGTLWDGSDATVTGAGLSTTPERFKVEIGQIAAKVRLESVSTSGQVLKGTFGDEFLYTLRSVPNRTYLLGKYDNSTANTPGAIPPALGIQFLSAVHNEPPLTGDTQNPVFTNYTWPAKETDNTGQAFYTVENTSVRMPLINGTPGHLYYGNTTYITLRTTYTPGPEDTFLDGSDPTRTAAYTGGKFWIGTYDNKRQAFATQPTHVNITAVSECRDGIMYYHFPLRDPEEKELQKSCAVIRNHFYRVEVHGFSGWGSGNDVEDPGKPIPDNPEEDAGVNLTITVLPWYSVSHVIE